MSRYDAKSGKEGETEPGSRGLVLRNLLRIKRKREADQMEFELLLAAQTSWLGRINSDTIFTTSMLRQMHRDWLGRMYRWAGEYRNVEMEKEGFRWPPARLVSQNMENFEAEFLRRYTPCHPADLAMVSHQVATVHAELLLVHPFRDGNGRLARWLADLMFSQAGFPLPRYKLSGRGARNNRLRYLNGVKAGYNQNYDLLAAFLADAVTRRL